MFLLFASLYSKKVATPMFERVILWAEIDWDKSKINKRQRVNGMGTFKLAILDVRIYMDC
jgi:hypothetical protein